MTFTLRWTELGAPRERAATDASEVDGILDDLEVAFSRGPPTLITVARADGASMSIGLGNVLSVVDHIPADPATAFAISWGNLPAAMHVPLSFEFEGELSELPPEAVLRLDAARLCLREFCATGRLSPTIHWQHG